MGEVELKTKGDFLSCLDFVCQLNEQLGGLHSIERPQGLEKASRGEIKRWFRNSAIHINGKAVKENDNYLDFCNTVSSVTWDANEKRYIQRLRPDSVMFFPKGKMKRTF